MMRSRSRGSSTKRGNEEPLQKDELEAIFSHVPLIDLVPASRVSKAWNRAVFSSLCHLDKPKPWLIVHKQIFRQQPINTMRAYDPRSDIWINIKSQPSIKRDTTVQSSHPNLLYMLSPSKLCVSLDPLHLTWHRVDPPKVLRVDPIVSVVGHHIIIAGRTRTDNFVAGPHSVEMYDQDSATWITCESMPAVFKNPYASTWISTATDGYKLFAVDKLSGVMHVFDPNTKGWSEPSVLRPDPNIFYSEIAFVNDSLILIGLIEDADDVMVLKLWRANDQGFEEVGEIPRGLLRKLGTKNSRISYFEVYSAGNFLYLRSNFFTEEELVGCEFVGGGCRWWSIENVETEDVANESVVFVCSKVGFNDVKNAMRSDKRRFTHFSK